MYSITLAATPAERDYLIAELWEAGTTGITESEDWIRAFFEGTEESGPILERFRDFRPQLEQEEQHDWVKDSQDRWQPTVVGERFYLVPEWRDDPAPCGRIRLRTHPGMAAGTGDHPATQLCLRVMERVVEDGQSVLDVGTGSGILADAAVLLGAGLVVGCDIDYESVQVAAKNLGNSVRHIPLFAGSVRSIRSEAFDVVVGNLNPAVLKSTGQDLQRVSKPAGRIILSGFKVDESDKVASGLGRPVQEQIEQEGWAALLL